VADVEYEPRDANVRVVVKFAIGLGALAALSAAVCFGTYVVLRNVHRANDPKAAPLAPRQGRVPPMPRLQAAPAVELQQLRAEQAQRLTTYGWQNQQMGTVHIPIEEAMKLYVQRAAGAAAAPAGAAADLDVPEEAAGPSGTATMPPVSSAPPSPPAPPTRASPPGGSPR
jgi:hypothetical protein